MPLNGITFDPVQVYGKEWKVLFLSLTVGASGAVAAVDGKGWRSDGTAGTSINNGSVTKESTDGQYSIVVPGKGSVHKMIVLPPMIEDATDVLQCTTIAKDLSARKVTLQFWGPTAADNTAPLATDLSSGTVVHFTILVKNSNID